MAKKSKLIKNLLTTASAVAVLATGVSSALGAGNNNRATVAGGKAVLNTGANLNAGGAAFDSGVGLQIGVAQDVQLGAALTIGALDVNNNNGQTVEFDDDGIIGAIADLSGNNKTVTLKTTAATKSITLSGAAGTNKTIDLSGIAAKDYSGLATIDLRGAGGNDGILILDTRSQVQSNNGLINGVGGELDLTAVDIVAAKSTAATLHVKTDGKFKAAFGSFKTIRIGDVAAGGGDATMTVDLAAANTNLLTAAAAGTNVNERLIFETADSELKIVETAGGNQTVTIANNTIGGYNSANAPTDDLGKLTVIAKATQNIQILANNVANNSIGLVDPAAGSPANKRLRELNVSNADVANGVAEVMVKVKAYAKTVNIGENTKLSLLSPILDTSHRDANGVNTDGEINLLAAGAVLDVDTTAAARTVNAENINISDATGLINLKRVVANSLDINANILNAGGDNKARGKIVLTTDAAAPLAATDYIANFTGNIGGADRPIDEMKFVSAGGNETPRFNVRGGGIWASKLDAANDGGVRNGILQVSTNQADGKFEINASTTDFGGVGERSLHKLIIADGLVPGTPAVAKATKAVLNGKIKLGAANNGGVEFSGALANELKLVNKAELSGAPVTLSSPAHVLELAGDSNANRSVVTAAAANGAAVVAAADGDGIVRVSGHGIVTSTVADKTIGDATAGGGNKVANIDFSTAGATLTAVGSGAAGGIRATTVVFNADNTKLILNEGSDESFSVRGDVVIPAGAGDSGQGIIEVDANVGAGGAQTVTIQGNVGDIAVANKKLNKIDIKNGVNANTTLVLDTGAVAGKQHIHNIDILQDSAIQLAGGGEFKIHQIHNQNGKGKIVFNANGKLTLGAGEEVIGSDNPLSAFDVNGKNVALGAGTHVVATKLANAAAAASQITFEGKAIVDASTAGIANALGAITLKGAAFDPNNPAAGDVVSIRGAEFTTGGAIQFETDTVFEFTGTTLAANNIVSTAPGTQRGRVHMNNSATQTLNSTVGFGDDVLIVLKDGVVNVSNTANGRFLFDPANGAEGNPQSTTLNFGNSVINEAKINSSNDQAEHTFTTTRNDTNLQGAGVFGNGNPLLFKGATNAVNTFILSSDKGTGLRFEVASGVTTGTLTINKEDITFRDLGASTTPFDMLVFQKDGTMSGNDGFVKNIVVNDGQTATFSNARLPLVEEVRLNDNADIIFGRDNFNEFSGKFVQTGTTNRGKVTFNVEKGIIKGQIGAQAKALEEVNFNAKKPANGATADADRVLKFQDNISVFAKNIKFADGVFMLESSELSLVANGGNVTFDGSTMDVGKNTLKTKDGGLVLKNATIRVGFDGSTFGSVQNSAGALSVENTGDNRLTIDVVDTTSLAESEGKSIKVIQNTGSPISQAVFEALKKANVTATANRFLTWTPTVDANGNVTLTAVNNTQKVLEDEIAKQIGTKDNQNVVRILTALSSAPKGSEAANYIAKFQGDLSRIGEAGERLDQSGPAAEIVSNVVAEALNTVDFAVGGRIAGLGGTITPDAVLTTSADGQITTGVAAGDDHERFGIWGSPFYTHATQDRKGDVAGYKSEAAGLSVGFDTKANDDLIIGGAFTYSSNEVKHKQEKSGDKTDVKSLLFSFYGFQQLTTNWFLQGIATVAQNETTTRYRRVLPGAGNFDVARGRYDSMSFNAELLAGYNQAMGSFFITPMAGVRFTRLNDGSFKETGSSFNLDINKKAVNKFEGIAGVRVAGTAYDVQGISVTPEVHGFVRHNFISKTPGVEVRNSGILLDTKTAKTVRTSGNAGVGVNARYGMMEYGVTYDASFASKYVAHTGALKVRVNF